MFDLLVLMFLFQLKHLLFDFLYQPPYQYLNKGKFGHPGGLLHAFQHAIPTMLLLSYYLTPSQCLALGMLEFVFHYLVDWAKMNINSKMKWGPLTTDHFWRLLGVDQFLHQLTYLFFIWYIVG